jgi:glutamate synthase (NADPH/NADH) large chain
LLKVQQAFGYTQEDFKFILEPMASQGEEATGAMGNDSPLPVLSDRAKPLFNYFKQLFAQVTNPPIDPIREEIVMSLISLVSPNPNLLAVDETEPTPRLEVHQPVLSPTDMPKLKNIEKLTKGIFRSITIGITTPAAQGTAGLSRSLYQVCTRVEAAVNEGYNVIILSDRGVDRDNAPIPALLACSAVHQHLVGIGLRTSCGLVIETGAAREVHHFATLAGYGARPFIPGWPSRASPGSQASCRTSRPCMTPRKTTSRRSTRADEGDVQDGHFHLPVLLWGADLRGRRLVISTWCASTSPARRPRSRASASRRSPKRR